MISPTRVGDLTLFGYIPRLEDATYLRIREQLGIKPQVWPIGDSGFGFYYSSYAETAQTHEVIAFKLGFLRSKDGTPLDTAKLLAQKRIAIDHVDLDDLGGNALVACLSKTDLKFSAAKTLLGIPQLYFSNDHESIYCSDRLNCLVQVLGRVDLIEDAFPIHMMYRSTPGPLTFYQQIRRMSPGAVFHWVDGKVEERIGITLDSLRKTGDEKQLAEVNEQVYRVLDRIVSDTISQARAAGHSTATLLSGGVDSTLIQWIANEHQIEQPARTVSYAVQVDGFNREVEYAQAASNLLQTQHQFISIKPHEFPELINRSIDVLGQPPILETEPSMLSIAEQLHLQSAPDRYYFSGQGADTVFGLAYSKKVKGVHWIKQLPFSAAFLSALSSVLSPASKVSALMKKGAEIILSTSDPHSYVAPANSIAVYADMNLLRKWFGDETIRRILAARRDFVACYSQTNHYLEKFHFIDLLTDTYELGVQRQQIFLAHRKEQVHPFFDDDLLRASLFIPADRRYIQGFQPKHILKSLLTQRTHASVAKRPKGFSIFEEDLLRWMREGSLLPLVTTITYPGIIDLPGMDDLLVSPDYTLWIVLCFDQFCKRRSFQPSNQ